MSGSGDDSVRAAAEATSTSTSDAVDIVAETASNYFLAVFNGPRGHLARIRCVAFFSVAPEVIYSVLTNPDNAGVFRDVADCCSRKILSEEKAPEQDKPRSGGPLRVVEVEQLGKVRLLGREATFRTKLRVAEDARGAPRRFSTRFELLRSDVLSTFDGAWTLEPETESGGETATTVATLEQVLTPRGVPRWLKFVPLAGN